MLSVAVVNQKGGVGKSSVVLGLASAAAERGLEVLLIDMDPQANTSVAVGAGGPDGFTVNDVLYADAKGSAAQAVTETSWGEHVWIIPASLELAERDADTRLGSEHRLAKALDDPELTQRFDLCLIDCPPSVGRLVSNALIAADRALIVTEPSFPASQGVANILASVETITEHYNPRLTVAGVVVNKVPARGREADFRVRELTDNLPTDLVWDPPIPHRVVIPETMGAAIPIHRAGSRAKDVCGVFDALLGRLVEQSASSDSASSGQAASDSQPSATEGR